MKNSNIITFFIMIVVTIAGITSKSIIYDEVYAADKSAANISAQISAGWNLGNSLDCYSNSYAQGQQEALNQENLWGNPRVTKELIDYVKGCGFTAVRIPVTWYFNTYRDESGNLHIKQEWLQRVAEVVNFCISDGLYVVLDSHHDGKLFTAGVSEERFASMLLDANSLWSEISTYFAAYDYHLIFEGYNEVVNSEKSMEYSANAAEQMNRLNQAFVNAVRAAGGQNSDRVLIVPTLFHDYRTSFLEGFKLPSDSAYKRLIIGVHFYPTGIGQDLDQSLNNLKGYSDKFGSPVMITEFGVKASALSEDLRSVYISNYVARAGSRGIKCFIWDNGALNDYGLVNRKDFSSSKTNLISAFFAGVNGNKYDYSSFYLFDSMKGIEVKRPDLATGIIREEYWTTVTVQMSDLMGIPVPATATKCFVTANSGGDASDVHLEAYVFYDASGNMVSSGWLSGGSGKILDIPSGASYVKVSALSPYRRVTAEEYAAYFKSGDLSLSVGFY
ncbi:MAG: glycoside hydrolase family 5 protein [Butyrivibrio sp.]|nr:glycoside hydrolase family 5 protein [Butyrivibrio sp.]